MPSRNRRPTVELGASSALLDSFADDVGSLWCSALSIGRLHRPPPSSIEFLRDYVSQSLPCIIENTIPDDTLAQQAFTIRLDELVEKCDASQVHLTVDVTPDGYGDIVRTVQVDNGTTKRIFVKPQEKTMTLIDFMNQLRSERGKVHPLFRSCPFDPDGRAILPLIDEQQEEAHTDIPCCTTNPPQVLYYSRQNDCLRTELKPIFDLNIFPPTFPWAEEAFGTGPPDAVNLWIGDERAVSSMHKDHYENLFYVLVGEKVFTLCPPGDAPFLYNREFACGTFHQRQGGDWAVFANAVTDDGSTTLVPWIESDVESLLNHSSRFQQLQRFPRLARAHPMKVTVRAGEMLYLPSLWFHRVTQTCETIGINYWYDMKFQSPLWCYFNFMQQMISAVDSDDEERLDNCKDDILNV